MQYIFADGSVSSKLPENLKDFYPSFMTNDVILVHKSHSAKYSPLSLSTWCLRYIELPVMQHIFRYMLPHHKPPPLFISPDDATEKGLCTKVLSVGNSKDYDSLKEGFILPETITLFHDGYPVVLESQENLCYLLALNLTDHFTPNNIPVDSALDSLFLKLYGKYFTQEVIDYFRKPSLPKKFPAIVIEEHPGVRDDYYVETKIFCVLQDKPPVFLYGSCPDLHKLAFALFTERVYISRKGVLTASLTEKATPPLPGVTLVTDDQVTVKDYSVLPPRRNTLSLPAQYYYSPTGLIIYSSASKFHIHKGVLNLPRADWKKARQYLLELDNLFRNPGFLEGFRLGEALNTTVQKLYDVLGVEITLSIPTVDKEITCLGDALRQVITGVCIQSLHARLRLDLFAAVLPQ